MTCQNTFPFAVLLENIDFIVYVHHCKEDLSEENVKMMIMQRLSLRGMSVMEK